MEHSGTSRNIPEHRIIMIIMTKRCKIKFSKAVKTSNLEVTKLKLHKCYNFMILLIHDSLRAYPLSHLANCADLEVFVSSQSKLQASFNNCRFRNNLNVERVIQFFSYEETSYLLNNVTING